jgi:hypothetical protein
MPSFHIVVFLDRAIEEAAYVLRGIVAVANYFETTFFVRNW